MRVFFAFHASPHLSACKRLAAAGIFSALLLCPTFSPAAAFAASKPAETPKAPAPVLKALPASPRPGASLPIAETWAPLVARLHKDGIPMEYLRGIFGRMGDAYSHEPMGTKLTELFTNKYVPRPPRTAPVPATATPRVYKGMVKPENVDKCKAYLTAHAAAFAGMEARYGVPKEVVAGLLMVETRLGTFLGRNSSFWSLACMAAADARERVAPVVQTFPLPMTPDKEEWLRLTLRQRSAWAYNELLALIAHSKANALDPLAMPGSVYGAIGICQFMPSNLPKFAVDGNKDGRVDLYDPADAIASVGNYLKEHGWTGLDRQEKNRAGHHAALKRYNKSNVYANTILALADAIAAPAGETGKTTAKVAKKKSAPKAVAKKAKASGKPAAKATPKKHARKSVRKPASPAPSPDKAAVKQPPVKISCAPFPLAVSDTI